jgi:hypothetical protein
LGAERAALKQAARDRLRQDGEAGGRRQGQTERDFVGARLRGRKSIGFAVSEARGDARHDHRGDGNGSDAERQFVEPVGVIEPRQRGRRRRDDGRRRDQFQLRDAGGDQTGPRADEQSSCLIRRASARAAPAFAGHQPSRAGDQKLHQPGQDDGPGDDQREFKLKNAHAGRQCGRRHHDDIEYHRADRDGADASFGIESRGQNGHQPRQQNIGRGNEQQKGRYGPAVRIESGRDDAYDERRENDDRQRDDAGHAQHRQQAAPGEPVGVGLAILGRAQREPNRHEGAIERAFRQQAPEEIDHLQHREKCF